MKHTNSRAIIKLGFKNKLIIIFLLLSSLRKEILPKHSFIVKVSVKCYFLSKFVPISSLHLEILIKVLHSFTCLSSLVNLNVSSIFYGFFSFDCYQTLCKSSLYFLLIQSLLSIVANYLREHTICLNDKAIIFKEENKSNRNVFIG